MLLQMFAAENDVVDSMTMLEVASLKIKPKTKVRSEGSGQHIESSSYAALVEGGGGADGEESPLVNTATIFTSYTWSYTWGVFLSALVNFDKTQDTTTWFFIDMFCLDQHNFNHSLSLTLEEQAVFQRRLLETKGHIQEMDA